MPQQELHVTSKTIGPLHFGDLEPHRFEDLVRQLIYDFRTWRSLEATGRSGSDQGFDVRGFQVVEGPSDPESDDEDQEVDSRGNVADRVWLIQCKREKSVTPKKFEKYAKEVDASAIYGVIFVAACDFSKTARDVFLTAMRGKGIQEVYIWGKAELEDMLFQPKNDHLLFAYFGFSLAIRRRSLRTEIRSKLSMKKKAISLLGELHSKDYKPVLIRDANGSSYPFRGPDFSKNPTFFESFFLGHYYDGIVCIVKEFFAYLHPDRKQWDYVPSFNETEYSCFMRCSHDYEERRKRWEERNPLEHFWTQLPVESRAMLEVMWRLPYEHIVAIDADGDEYGPCPHIYCPFDRRYRSGYAELKLNRQTVMYDPPFEDRIKFFPEVFPSVEAEKAEEPPQFPS
jgi:hypothetical protein